MAEFQEGKHSMTLLGVIQDCIESQEPNSAWFIDLLEENGHRVFLGTADAELFRFKSPKRIREITERLTECLAREIQGPDHAEDETPPQNHEILEQAVQSLDSKSNA